MSIESDTNHWPEFENTVAAILAEQEAIRYEIDESMSRSDLLGATMGSFEHVLTSFQLGDRADAQAYMLMGIALAQAEIIFASELSPPASIIFDVPSCASREPNGTWVRKIGEDGIGRRSYEKDEKYYTQLAINEKVTQSVAAAEAVLLLGPDYDTTETNKVSRGGCCSNL